MMGKYLVFLNEHKDDSLANKIAKELDIIFNAYWDAGDIFLFTDKITGTTFSVKNLKDTKNILINKRKEFGI
jgi:hypothetical protein